MSTYENVANAQADLSEPTLMRLQARRRRKPSAMLVPLIAIVAVVAIGAAGLYALTGPHGGAHHTAHAVAAGPAAAGG